MIDDVCIINGIEYEHLHLTVATDLYEGPQMFHIRCMNTNYDPAFRNYLYSLSGVGFVWFHINNIFMYGKVLYLGSGNLFYIIKEQYFDEY